MDKKIPKVKNMSWTLFHKFFIVVYIFLESIYLFIFIFFEGRPGLTCHNLKLLVIIRRSNLNEDTRTH